MAKRNLVICYAFVPGNRNQARSIAFSSGVDTGRVRKTRPTENPRRNPGSNALCAKSPAGAIVNALKAENACVASTQAFPGAEH